MIVKQLLRISFVAVLVVTVALAAQAASIPVPNGDFEDYTPIGAWASLGGPLPDQLGENGDEFWTNPSSFASGWTQLTGRRTDGRWGLQHPNGSSHHARNVANVAHGQDNALDGPTFSGHFIGFANMDANDTGGATYDGTGPQEVFEIQSQILGQLTPGVYSAALDVGFRAAAAGGANPWNDHRYDIALVAGGVAADGTNGSTGGSTLGVPGSIILTRTLGALGLGANQTTVNYALVVPPGHANLGDDFALRIFVENLGTRDGIPSPAGIEDFTQANFDNARVEFVPEPASALLGGLAAMALAAALRRRK